MIKFKSISNRKASSYPVIMLVCLMFPLFLYFSVRLSAILVYTSIQTQLDMKVNSLTKTIEANGILTNTILNSYKADLDKFNVFTGGYSLKAVRKSYNKATDSYTESEINLSGLPCNDFNNELVKVTLESNKNSFLGALSRFFGKEVQIKYTSSSECMIN